MSWRRRNPLCPNPAAPNEEMLKALALSTELGVKLSRVTLAAGAGSSWDAGVGCAPVPQEGAGARYREPWQR